MQYNDIYYKKIEKLEFDKLREIFPGNEETWSKYRKKRLTELENKEVDVYVIEKNNEFIGEITVNYVSHDLPSETILDKRVYLEAFRVKKQYTGQGLGQKLMDYVLTSLKAKGYTEFTIGVEDNNKIAKHIYYKYGFTEAIDRGHGNEFDSCDYTLFLKQI